MQKYKLKIMYSEKINNEEKDSIIYIMSRYNLENFNEIINSSFEGLDDEIDEKELKDFQDRIDHYFRLHAPEDEEFKEFIKAISIYLTFIAKKKLYILLELFFQMGMEYIKKMMRIIVLGKVYS